MHTQKILCHDRKESSRRKIKKLTKLKENTKGVWWKIRKMEIVSSKWRKIEKSFSCESDGNLVKKPIIYFERQTTLFFRPKTNWDEKEVEKLSLTARNFLMRSSKMACFSFPPMLPLPSFPVLPKRYMWQQCTPYKIHVATMQDHFQMEFIIITGLNFQFSGCECARVK